MNDLKHVRDPAPRDTLTSMPGRTLRLPLALAGAMLITPAAAFAQAGASEAAATSESRQLWIGGAVSMGLGAALMVPMALGISEYVSAASEIERYNERARAAGRRFTPNEFVTIEGAYARSHRMQALAISAGAIGGALAFGGLALYLVGARRAREPAAARSVRVSPTFGSRLTGLSISARF